MQKGPTEEAERLYLIEKLEELRELIARLDANHSGFVNAATLTLVKMHRILRPLKMDN